MFKIVQTNGNELSAVPASWEINGVLYWPPGRSGFNLRKNAKNIPDNTWTKENCVVKRNDIQSFKEALQLEKSLAKFADTEDEENTHAAYIFNRKHPAINIPEDFNCLMNVASTTEFLSDNCFTTNNNIDENIVSDQLIQTAENIQPVEDAPESAVNTHNDIENAYPLQEYTVVQSTDILKIDQCLENQKQIQETLIELRTTNTKMLNHVTGLDLQLQKLIDVIEISISLNTTKNNQPQETQNEISESEFMKMFPIDTLEAMELLESQLKDAVFASNFTKYLSRFGGVSGNNRYEKISYMVFDAVISKSFVTKCSYTGSSKSTENKITFKSFKYFIEHFYNVIKMADSRYTIDENLNFIKRILKNSVKRYQLSVGVKPVKSLGKSVNEVDDDPVSSCSNVTNKLIDYNDISKENL